MSSHVDDSRHSPPDDDNEAGQAAATDATDATHATHGTDRTHGTDGTDGAEQDGERGERAESGESGRTDASDGSSLLHRARARVRRAGRWLRAHTKHALVVAVVAGLVSGIVPIVFGDVWKKVREDPPPECPGAGCHGRSPKTEWCAGDATTWQPEIGNPVVLQVRYSKRCGAVWGRITRGEPGDVVSVHRDDGASQHNSIQYGPDQFTRMVVVGKKFHIRVCADPTTSPRRKGRWVEYCVEATERTNWQ